MKTLSAICSAVLMLLLTSCENSEIFYDAPFPKKNKDLSEIIGSDLSVKRRTDTLYLKIKSDKDKNLITYNTGDTLFYGTVSKYRGLYYFSEEITPGNYFISAVKISDSLIYGLDYDWSQMFSVKERIKNGKYNKLLKFINSDSTQIILHPYKKEMKNLYKNILEEITPDTIFETSKKPEDNNNTEKIETDDMEIIKKVFPNPVTDILNIEVQTSGLYSFKISDLNGKKITEGKITEKYEKIDVKKLPKGMYILTIINNITQEKESIKIIKSN